MGNMGRNKAQETSVPSHTQILKMVAKIARKNLDKLCLFARTKSEIENARIQLREYMARHPEDVGARSLGETLYMVETGLDMVSKA